MPVNLIDSDVHVFLSLVKAGLWEQDIQLVSLDGVEYAKLMRLSEEQSVLGLVAAGLEHIKDAKFPQEEVLQYVARALSIEKRNKAMDDYIGFLINKLRNADIYTILLKGQGIAQCYERPFLRGSGDIDLFLSEINYQKAKSLLLPLALKIEEENSYNRHLAIYMDKWEVELHGSLRCGLWNSIDRTLDDVQRSVFFEGKVRSWLNGKTQVFLLKADEDIIYVFSHILQHFFKEGIGLRQICDWCRLLYTYRDSLNHGLLESRIKRAGLMSEWKAFGVLAVEYLGMPADVMPFYSDSLRWKKKAALILDFIIETGNFGHNRDYSYYKEASYLNRKTISLSRHTSDAYKYFRIFPFDSIKLWCQMIKEGVVYVAKGK